MSKSKIEAPESCPQCAAEGESESYPFGPVSFDVCKARELVLLYPREKKLWTRQYLEDYYQPWHLAGVAPGHREGSVKYASISLFGYTEQHLAHLPEGRLDEPGIEESLNRMKCEAALAAIEAHIEGQKYLSDNQLKATHIEASARRETIVATEKLRAEARRGASRDRLEEAVRVAALKFRSEVEKAEILRASAREDQRTNVVTAYLDVQTQLILAGLQQETALALIELELEKARSRNEGRKYKQDQKTAREGIRALKSAIERGDEQAEIKIRKGDEEIEITFKGKKKKS